MKKNIFYLSLIQVLRFLTPLITFPYLTRVLGVEGFGMLAYASGIVIYLTLIVEFGFSKISIIKVTKLRENKNALSNYIVTIFCSQLILYSLSILILLILHLLLSFSLDLFKLILILSLSSLGLIFTPNWLFLGLERIKELIPFTLFGRLISILLTIFFVNGPDDLLIAGLVQSSAFLISGLICIIYLITTKILFSYTIKLAHISQSFKDSFFIFITNFASNLYMAAVPIIIGIVLGPTYVAFYKVSDNIKSISLNLMNPIFNAVYSRFNSLYNKDRQQSILFINRYFKLSLTLSILGSSILFIFSKYIIEIIAGNNYLPAEIVLKIHALVITISVLNQYLGTQTLITLGYHKIFSFIVCIGGCLSIIFIYPLIKEFNITGAAMSVAISEIIIFILLTLMHSNKKIKIFF